MRESKPRECVGRRAPGQSDVKLVPKRKSRDDFCGSGKLDLPVSAEGLLHPHTLLSAKTNELCSTPAESLQRAGHVSGRRLHCPLATDLKWDKHGPIAATQNGPDSHSAIPGAGGLSTDVEYLVSQTSQGYQGNSRSVTSGSRLPCNLRSNLCNVIFFAFKAFCGIHGVSSWVLILESKMVS